MNEIQVFTQRLVSQSTAQFIVSESKDIDAFIEHIKSVIQTCKAMAPKQTQPVSLATKKKPKPKPKKSSWKKAEATTPMETVVTAPVQMTQSETATPQAKSLGRGIKKDPSEWSPSYRKLMEYKARKAAKAAMKTTTNTSTSTTNMVANKPQIIEVA